jgi:hypothetical protein
MKLFVKWAHPQRDGNRNADRSGDDRVAIYNWSDKADLFKCAFVIDAACALDKKGREPDILDFWFE